MKMEKILEEMLNKLDKKMAHAEGEEFINLQEKWDFLLEHSYVFDGKPFIPVTPFEKQFMDNMEKRMEGVSHISDKQVGIFNSFADGKPIIYNAKLYIFSGCELSIEDTRDVGMSLKKIAIELGVL